MLASVLARSSARRSSSSMSLSSGIAAYRCSAMPRASSGVSGRSSPASSRTAAVLSASWATAAISGADGTQRFCGAGTNASSDSGDAAMEPLSARPYGRAMLTIVPIDELANRAGTELGVTDGVRVTQQMVNAFAEVTGDHQWIHTDPLRAAASPFGGTIAHGYLTLSLAPVLLEQVLPLEGYALTVNYGLDRLRFPAPLRVGESVRMRVTLDAVDPIPGGARLTLTLIFEPTAGGKPVCVATAIYRIVE